MEFRRVLFRSSGAPERRFQLRQYLEQISHQPDVRDLENRRLGILVDRHDRARVLDAGQVLDRAADADGHVQVRGDDLAGLADLRSEEHTSELQSLMRISYAVFCLKKKNTMTTHYY